MAYSIDFGAPDAMTNRADFPSSQGAVPAAAAGQNQKGTDEAAITSATALPAVT